MSTAFYTRMQGVSKRLINTYGTPCQILEYSEDNAETVLSTQNGVANVMREDDYSNTLTAKAEQIIYIAPENFVPEVDQYVRWNNDVYKIIYVNVYKPAAMDVLYGLYVRK